MMLQSMRRSGYSTQDIATSARHLVARRTEQCAASRRITQKAATCSTRTSHESSSNVVSTTIRRNRALLYCIAGIVTTTGATSLAVRKWREEHMDQLPLASSCGAFYLNNDTRRQQDNSSKKGPRQQLIAAAVTTENTSTTTPVVQRELHTLLQTIIRAGLMGGKKSVKEELEHIRNWHQSNGFHGGLVVRELTQPLYYINDDDDEIIGGADDVEPIPIHQLNQRECYYMYYELRPDGQVRQEIFCRGTTLAADVWTGIQSMLMYTYDDELKCSLHKGFRDHANRLLDDLQPLLLVSDGATATTTATTTTNSRKRATVELCGHSLGGAVAIIVACKLKKRGYNVIRVTTVGAPRVCKWDAVSVLSTLLPKDTLRIENDLDVVCYLPPQGKGLLFEKNNELSLPYVGNKLLFLSDGIARFIPVAAAKEFKWVDSFLLNGRLFEMMRSMPKSHKMPSYSEHIQRLIHTFENANEKQSGD